MKLLFDHNLSFRLARMLADLYPGSVHVREFGLERADDEVIWQLAASQGFIIASKDNDFHQRSFVRGHPPKVIWVRIGNCTTDDIQQLLRDHHAEIVRFAEDPVAAFLALG